MTSSEDSSSNSKPDVEQGGASNHTSPSSATAASDENGPETAAATSNGAAAAAAPSSGPETRTERLRSLRRLRKWRREHPPTERPTSPGLLFWGQAIENLNNEEMHPDLSVSLRHHRTDLDTALDPPLARREVRRDNLLETIANNKWIMVANILVLFLVVGVGALWFFFLLGWQTLCTPATDCEPRNTVYNVSIHIMTGLFTWMSTIVMPWRWVHTLHTLGYSNPYRSNDIGKDLYGLPTDDPWFHVPKQKRMIVLFFLDFNCFFQYANQVCRGIYWSYDASNEFPGNFWTSIWFVLSLTWALIGALLFWKHTSIVRETDKERFGPGPIEMIREMYESFQKRRRGEVDIDENGIDNGNADEETAAGVGASSSNQTPALPSIEEVSPSQEVDMSQDVRPETAKRTDATDNSATEMFDDARS